GEAGGCAGDPSEDPYWVGWPGYAIDEPASEARAMGWQEFRYGATGELYYAVDHDLVTAWKDQWAFGGNGDGTLFYPGKPSIIGGARNIPIESIRLKLIRDGEQDYEYLRFLARHGLRAKALGIAKGLFPRIYESNRSNARVQAARKKLADLVAGVVGGPAP